MKNRSTISVMVLALLMIISQPAKADDLADLKAANEKYFNAWNTADVDTFSEFWIDGGVWLSDARAFPLTITKGQPRKAYWVKWFETHSIRFTWYNPQFLVIGTTGLVWGHMTQAVINKEKGMGKETYLKMSVTYAKSEDGWKMVLLHSSPIPSHMDIF